MDSRPASSTRSNRARIVLRIHSPAPKPKNHSGASSKVKLPNAYGRFAPRVSPTIDCDKPMRKTAIKAAKAASAQVMREIFNSYSFSSAESPDTRIRQAGRKGSTGTLAKTKAGIGKDDTRGVVEPGRALLGG